MLARGERGCSELAVVRWSAAVRKELRRVILGARANGGFFLSSGREGEEERECWEVARGRGMGLRWLATRAVVHDGIWDMLAVGTRVKRVNGWETRGR